MSQNRNDRPLIWSKNSSGYPEISSDKWFCRSADIHGNNWVLQNYLAGFKPDTGGFHKTFSSEKEARATASERHQNISWHDTYMLSHSATRGCGYFISVKKNLYTTGWHLECHEIGYPVTYLLKNERIEDCMFLGEKLIMLILRHKKLWNSWNDAQEKALFSTELSTIAKDKGLSSFTL